MSFNHRSTPVINDYSINFLDGTPMQEVEQLKYLGVHLDAQMTFKPHMDSIIKNVNYRLRTLWSSIDCFTLSVRKRIATQLLLTILDYADVVYQNSSVTNLHSLDVIYNSLCRFILRCPYRTNHCNMYASLNWTSLTVRRQLHWLQFIFKCIYQNYRSYSKELLCPLISTYNLRHTEHLFYIVPKIKKEIGRKAFKYKAPSDWNALPGSIRSITSLNLFKNEIFIHLHTVCCCF